MFQEMDFHFLPLNHTALRPIHISAELNFPARETCPCLPGHENLDTPSTAADPESLEEA